MARSTNWGLCEGVIADIQQKKTTKGKDYFIHVVERMGGTDEFFEDSRWPNVKAGDPVSVIYKQVKSYDGSDKRQVVAVFQQGDPAALVDALAKVLGVKVASRPVAAA